MKLEDLKNVGVNASTVVAAPPPMAPEPEEAPVNEPPADPVQPDGPRYKAGDKVRVGDETGVVEGEAMPEKYAYQVKCGEKMRVAAEQGMEPSKEEPAVEDAPVIPEMPADVAAALGLPADCTVADAVEAITALKSENDTLVGDKSAALKAAGVKADVADFASQALTRPAGKTWGQAVEALKASRPSLFEAAAPAAETKQEIKDAPVVVDLPRLPVGSVSPAAPAAANVRGSGKGYVFNGGRIVKE